MISQCSISQPIVEAVTRCCTRVCCIWEERQETAGRCLRQLGRNMLSNQTEVQARPKARLNGSLCSGEERRETAGRCLGELVRKMGERVLATIIPILAQGMEAPKVQSYAFLCMFVVHMQPELSASEWTRVVCHMGLQV